jgi:hypothetical protein
MNTGEIICERDVHQSETIQMLRTLDRSMVSPYQHVRRTLNKKLNV